MSKKKHAPLPAKPMRKLTGSKVTQDHDNVSANFRHCRPKRDWGNDKPADNTHSRSIK